MSQSGIHFQLLESHAACMIVEVTQCPRAKDRTLHCAVHDVVLHHRRGQKKLPGWGDQGGDWAQLDSLAISEDAAQGVAGMLLQIRTDQSIQQSERSTRGLLRLMHAVSWPVGILQCRWQSRPHSRSFIC